MIHFLHLLSHILKAVWRDRIALFWPIWIAITAVGVMLVMWVVPQGESVPLDSIPFRRPDRSRSAIFAVVFLSAFLACYLAGSLVWEDFTYYDNSHFTNESLVGHNIPLQVSSETGRFWPLGYQEFNLVRRVTHSILGYHALRIVQLLLLSWIILVFEEDLKFTVLVALIAMALITPSILISFSGLIYPDWNVIFWFICLVWFVKRFGQTRSTAWAVAALVSAQFMLYYKETAFLLLLGFALGRLFLRCREMDRAGWNFTRLRSSESRLDICLAIMVAPFLIYYLAARFPNYRTGYNDDFRLPMAEVLASYLRVDLLVWVFVAVVLVRVVLILRRDVAPSPLWDGLALAGMSCLGGYLCLRMYSAYYLAPVDLIAILYLGWLAVLSVGKMRFGTKLCALALLSLVLLQDISLSAFRMYERKNVIHAKAEMGRVIEARFESDPQNVKRLFFPFASPFQVLEFASYLNYLGVPVERAQAGFAATGSVELAGEAIKKDGPCGYRAFVCHAGRGPDPGDLVVVLPDDLTRSDELNSYQHESAGPLFSYHPRPSIPLWLRSYVNCLHVVSPVFAHNQLPDLWLHASVTVWQ
jgi:hypothetical protein